jgi:hypothetical protein
MSLFGLELKTQRNGGDNTRHGEALSMVNFKASKKRARIAGVDFVKFQLHALPFY